MRDFNFRPVGALAFFARWQAFVPIAVIAAFALSACQHTTTDAIKPSVIFGGKDKGGKGSDQ